MKLFLQSFTSSLSFKSIRLLSADPFHEGTNTFVHVPDTHPFARPLDLDTAFHGPVDAIASRCTVVGSTANFQRLRDIGREHMFEMGEIIRETPRCEERLLRNRISM